MCTWKVRPGQDVCRPQALVESTVTVHTSSLKFHSHWHGHHRQGTFLVWVLGVHLGRQGPSSAPYQLSPPGIDAGTTALIHVCDLGEAIQPLTWFYFIVVVQVTPSCLFTQTKSASDKMSLGHVHVDTGTFNCSWSLEATKPFIPTVLVTIDSSSPAPLTDFFCPVVQLLPIQHQTNPSIPDPTMGDLSLLLTQFNFNGHVSILQAWLKADRRSAPETMVNCKFITIFAFYYPPLCPD